MFYRAMAKRVFPTHTLVIKAAMVGFSLVVTGMNPPMSLGCSFLPTAGGPDWLCADRFLARFFR